MKQNELVLIEKFMLELSCKEAAIPINDFFKNIRESGEYGRYQMLVQGFTAMRSVTMEHNDTAHQCISSILFGLMIAELIGDPHIEEAIKGFCEHKGKERGDHVVDFNKFKAGR